MVQINGRVEGLRELAKNSDKLRKSFGRSTLRTALRNGAKPVRVRARADAPKEEGLLRRNIITKAKVVRSGFGYVDIGATTRGFYGYFHELGTSQIAARPFLRPALDSASQSGEIIDGFVNAMNKTISRTLNKVR